MNPDRLLTKSKLPKKIPLTVIGTTLPVPEIIRPTKKEGIVEVVNTPLVPIVDST